LKKYHIKPFKNLLFPKSGIFNILIEKLKDNVENIYDISIIYKVNGNRVLTEFEILKAIDKPSFEINVKIKKYNINDFMNDPGLLYRIWSLKDKWIESYF
jgi:hypothetical protein